MKFKINAKVFALTLSTLSKVVPTKSAINVLYYILLEVKDGILTATASDESHSVTIKQLAVADSEDGEVLVKANKLTELAAKFADGEVIVSSNEERMTIATDSGRYHFATMPTAEFPKRSYPETDSFSVPSELLLNAIRNTRFAVGTDPLRPQMMGILLEFNENSLVSVATDTHILAAFEQESTFENPCTMLIPTNTVDHINRVFGALGECDIQVSLTDNGIRMKTESVDFFGPLLNGRFPDWKRVMPSQFAIDVIVDRKEFINTLQRVALFADDQTHLTKLTLSNGKIEVTSNDGVNGNEGESSLPCNYEGSSFRIGVNHLYITNALRKLTQNDIMIQFNTHMMPMLLSEGVANTLTRIIVMPLNINDSI